MAKRAILIVLDSVGCGAAPDAAAYGDEGSNTLSNIIRVTGGLDVPNLNRLGLSLIEGVEGLPAPEQPQGGYGRMQERSSGKDTTTGHWEMAGLVLEEAFPTYPNGFPPDVIEAFSKLTGRGVLGNKTASGTAIIEELGQQHLDSGDLIVYTSADSVFQIAAHEELVPPEQLYEICRQARDMLVEQHAVGRVIARPFVGKAGSFTRTGNRRDFSLTPVSDTILDLMKATGHQVLGVGKIEDIFAHRGLTGSNHASGNPACIEATLQYMNSCREGLIFTNLVDFDMLYGHRNNPEGYRRALEDFDRALPEILDQLGDEDLLILTADHGCDPTTPSTDHSREYVPLLCWSPAMGQGVPLGTCHGFTAVAATIGDFFGLEHPYEGSVLTQLGLG